MKYFLFTFCILSLISCKTEPLTDSSWELINIPAPSLENSIIENSKTQTIGVYLPPSYKLNPKEHYPVVYYLQGYNQKVNEKGYLCWILDSLIKEEQIPEMILVSISGKYEFGGSFYENSPVIGNWEDFVIKDVVSFVDENYKTIAKAESRAITGHSMGGYGALNLGMKHPDIYKVVYSMSPGLFNSTGLKNSHMYKPVGSLASIINLQKQLSRINKEDAHDKFLALKDSIKDWNVEFTIAYGICFSPETSRAPYFEYPITITENDTIINSEIWNAWDKGFGNVSNELETYSENLRELNLLALDCGYYDNFEWITHGTKFYAQELERLNIPHITNWHNGTHSSRFSESAYYGLFPTTAIYLNFKE